jgi:hypothetical protein
MSNYHGADVEKFETQYIVVNPVKLFANDDPKDWVSSSSNQGMLKLSVDCHFGVSGIQGTISEARPPAVGDEIDPYGSGFWAGTQYPGKWDGYEMLGFIQIPNDEGYTIQLFFIDGTFFDRCHETICTVTIEQPDSEYPGLTGDNLETVWAHIYRELFVKKFGAVPLAGHKWATCPCDECSSPTSKGICSTPTPI